MRTSERPFCFLLCSRSYWAINIESTFQKPRPIHPRRRRHAAALTMNTAGAIA